MFAVLAAVVFFLMAVDFGIGALNMLYLALCLLSLHLAFGGGMPVIPWRKKQ